MAWCRQGINFVAAGIVLGKLRNHSTVVDEATDRAQGLGTRIGQGADLKRLAVGRPVAVFDGDKFHHVHLKNIGGTQLASSKKNNTDLAGPMQYLGLGFEFLGAFLMCAGAGYLVDRYLTESGRPGLFLIAGVFVGFGAGLWHLIRRTSAIGEWEKLHLAEKKQAREADEDVATKADRITREIDAVSERIGRVLEDHERRARRRSENAATPDNDD